MFSQREAKNINVPMKKQQEVLSPKNKPKLKIQSFRQT